MSDARKRLNHLMVPNNIVRRMNAEMLERIDRRDAELDLAQVADVATDFGRITAGQIDVADGAFVANDNGATLAAGLDEFNQVKWVDDDGNVGLSIGTNYIDGTISDAFIAVADPGGGNFANLLVSVGGRTTFSIYDDNGNYPIGLFRDGWPNALHYGGYAAAFSITPTTTPAAVYSTVAKANSLGTKGQIDTVVEGTIVNAAGANRTYSPVYNFGSYAWAPTATAQGNGTARFKLEVTTFLDQAQNAQIHLGRYRRWAVAAADADAAPTDDFEIWGSSAVTTTSDVALSVTFATSNNTGTQTIKGVGRNDHGPYYG